MNDDVFTREYSFHVVAELEGGYTILFPDLPGCMTQVESMEEVSAAAQEIKNLWIESVLAQGLKLPEPTFGSEYSGRFVVRIPRTLHRELAMSAESEGVSLNQYVVTLLTRQYSLHEIKQSLIRQREITRSEHSIREQSYAGVIRLPDVRVKRNTALMPQAV